LLQVSGVRLSTKSPEAYLLMHTQEISQAKNELRDQGVEVD
jgi:hypothetical protein